MQAMDDIFVIEIRPHRRAALWLCVSAMLIVSGCHDSPTITWKSEQPSPDGHWVAVAHSEIIGNFGGQYDQTLVQLKEVGRQSPENTILILSHEYKDIILSMNWDTPSHLSIRYRESPRPGDHVDINFQAIKCGNVTISVVKA